MTLRFGPLPGLLARLPARLSGRALAGAALLAALAPALLPAARAFAPEGPAGAEAAAAAGPVSTAATGARCIGSAFDDTAAFQAAIDTGHTVYAPALGGQCHITRPLVMKTPGQIFHGDGRARTKIAIQPGFAGAGVFVAKTGEPGPVWRDFSVQFLQPDTDDRAKLTRYPPAFSVPDTPRFEMEHLGCYVATTCVDMKGNSGGATIADLQMSAFEVGIDIDGSLDTVRLLSIHGWPFDASSRQRAQIASGVTWVRAGKVDDLKIVDSLFLTGIGLSFNSTAAGTATGSVTNTDFDSDHKAITMTGGNVSVTGGYFASAGPEDQQVLLTGGTLGIYNATMGCSSAGTPTDLAAVEIDGVHAFLTIDGSPSFICGGDDRPILLVRRGTAIFSNNNIQLAPNKVYLRPKILVLTQSSRLSAIGNRLSDKGSGDGIFISIEADNFNKVIGNAAPGWRSLLVGKPMPTTLIVGHPGNYFAN